MSVRAFIRHVIRSATNYLPVREFILRTLMRADEIMPFGHGLEFDPRTWVIKETQYGFRIWVALAERSISREILLDRYELDEVDFVRRTIKAGDHVVDIGANIGFYTALMATLVGETGHVTAFEPLDEVARALERTIMENELAARVTLHRLALYSDRRTVMLRHAPITINQGAAYIAPSSTLPTGHVDVPVRAETLDAIVGDAPCAFIKLDAEGTEPKILAGASATLARCRPVVLAELNPTLLALVSGAHANDVIAQMRQLGYVTHLLSGGSTVIERYDGATSLNAVFVPIREIDGS